MHSEGEIVNILMATMKMEIGGAETHILELARELVRRGHSVTVASAGGVFADALTESGVRHVTMPLHTKHPKHMLRSYQALCELVRENHFDIIHAHARIPGFITSFVARRFDIPMVTTFHGTFNPVWYLRMMTRVGARTLAVSDDIKEYLMHYYHTPAERIGMTVNGIDIAQFDTPSANARAAVEAELSLPAGDRIMAVTRLDREAAQHVFKIIDAMPMITAERPNATLTIVGGGDVLDEVQAAADEMNHTLGDDKITVVGPRSDIARILAAADVFVGVSRAAMEAMACRIPVVLSGAQGHLGMLVPAMEAEAIQTNFCCRTREPADTNTMGEAVLQLLAATPEQRCEMGAYNRSIIERYYSVGRMTDDAVTLYHTALKEHIYRSGDVVICGYYGFGNMGDDSLLSAIISNLRDEDPAVKMTVMSHHTRETSRINGIRAVNRFNPLAVIREMRRAKVLIFGGGNLLQDGSSSRSLLYYTWILKTAKRCGCKIMVYANGIGPLHLEKNKRAAAKALSLADIITLRERDSVRECEALGVKCGNIRLTADPAFTLREADASWTDSICARFGITQDKRYYVVALREWKKNPAEREQAMARICDRIYEEFGLIPVFLPMHEPLDVEISRKVQSMCHCESVYLTGLTGSEMLGVLRRMEFVAAMRLHTLIYSTAVGTPAIGLAYDGKLRAFMETTDQPFMLDGPDEEQFLSAAKQILCERESISAAMQEKLQTYRDLARRDAKDVFDLMRRA